MEIHIEILKHLLNKINDLSALLLMDSFDIVALTETWLDDDFNDRKFHLEGYFTFRCDRCVWRGGGALLAVKSHIPCVRRCDSNSFTSKWTTSLYEISLLKKYWKYLRNILCILDYVVKMSTTGVPRQVYYRNLSQTL